MGVTWHRNAFVDDAKATVSVRAKAFNYGLGCFGGIRAYWDERQDQLFVFRLRDHVERLVESARILGLESPFPPERIAEIRRNRVQVLADRNLDDYVDRVQIANEIAYLA